MNTPIPHGPERGSGPVGGPADSGAPARSADTADDQAGGMDIPESGEPPDAIPDEEYEPL
jgi:hypothetical protein